MLGPTTGFMIGVLQCLAAGGWGAKDLDARFSRNRRIRLCQEEMVPVHRELEKEVEGWEQAAVAAKGNLKGKVAKGPDAWVERQQAQSGFASAPSAKNDNLISEECHALSKSVLSVAQLWRENKTNSKERRKQLCHEEMALVHRDWDQ